jgi:hypothetical protein
MRGEADSQLGEKDVEAKFDELRKQLGKDFVPSHGRNVVFHYCSTESAGAIIESGKLRATDLRFLNDPTEWQHGHELVLADLGIELGRAKSIDDEARLKSLIQRVGLRKERSFLALVASLSHHRDSLALWRFYAVDGAGCSLGIDFDKVPDWGEPGGAAAAYVVYDAAEKEEQIRRAVRAHLDLEKQLRPFAEMNLLLHWCSVSLEIQSGLMALAFKHDAYKPEQEWRLVQMRNIDDAEVRHRPTTLGLAPYDHIDVSAAIVEVGLGPKQPSNAVRQWEDWLRRQERGHIRVWRSGVPYR